MEALGFPKNENPYMNPCLCESKAPKEKLLITFM